MGNDNSRCCSTNQLTRRSSLRDGAEERLRMFPGGSRRNTQTKSRSKSVERRRRGRRNSEVSPKGRRSSRSRSTPRSYGNPNEVAQAGQQHTPRNFVSPSRFSYDIPSRKGSSYVDPLSFTPSGSGLGILRGGKSSLDLWYFTSTSPAAGRANVTSGTRRATDSHNLISSDENRWRETKAKGRSKGDEAERPAYQSHVSSVSEKVYNSGQPQIQPGKSRLIAPGRQKVHCGSREQKRNSIRGSNSQHSLRGYAQRTKPQYKVHHDASRSLEDSFIPPSLGRDRTNAVRVETYEMPSGVYNGDQRYIQFGNDIWETVTIDCWNYWNGTWQVLDTSGHSIQAAPLALKTEDEYRFLSKKRTISYRSFGSSQ